MQRSYSAVVALALLFLVGTLVPSLPTVVQSVSREAAPGPTNAVVEDTEQGDVKLNTVHFSPSVSSEEGIYYVARRGVDTIAYFGESEVWYVVGDTLLHLDFPGSARVTPVGDEPTGSVTNYILGNEPAKWKTGLKDYSILKYTDIYPGIDLKYRILDSNLKYEFVVAPYANPSLIQLRYPDADLVEVHKDTVTISKNGFTVADTGLMSFQEGGRACIVNSAFHSLDSGTIALSIGQHDSSCVLVIDPLILVSSTFLGGSGDDIALNIAVESGYVYVTGITGSVNFPPKSADDYALGGITDCYVVKYSTNLSSVIYSTYLGGSDSDEGRAIAVYNGFAYVTGITNSSDFPVENAFKDHYLGGDRDCYVTKLAANGQALIYSTFMGGNGTDIATGIAVQSGYAYITGYTTSTNFLTVNPYQQYKKGPWDSFLTKFATDGQSLVYSTYLGGSGNELAYDIAVEAGKAYLIGITNSTIDFPTIPTENAFQSNYQAGPIDGFVTKFTSEGQDLEYSTYLGGGGTEYPWAIAVESGYAYVVGQTSSLDFPTLNAYDSTLDGPGDGFVVKLSYDGLTLEYGTFLGGSSGEAVWSIAVEDGLAYVAGHTWSSDFPTVDALDSSYNGGADCFVAVLAAEGKSLIHSTFLGASGNEHISAITVEDDYIYVGGYTDSIDFPTEAGCDSTHNGAKDCFVAMICHQAATTTTTTDLGQMQLRLAATGAAATVIFGVFGFAFKSDMLEKKRYKGAICVFALLVFVAASYYLWTYLLP